MSDAMMGEPPLTVRVNTSGRTPPNTWEPR